MQRFFLDRMVVLIACATAAPDVGAAPLTIVGPAGSGAFGQQVAVLPNGRIVVTDPRFDLPNGTVDAGAVHLYARDGTRISTLTGSSAADFVGSQGVVVLANGNYVVRSPFWNRGAVADAGAVTFATAAQGIDGVVAAANSLVGRSAGDMTGLVTALANGNYVVSTPNWDGEGAADAGAVTFGNGNTGIAGAVDAGNSLIGTTAGDRVGLVVALTNGNYVVHSGNWDDGAIADVGAVTWADGGTGLVGRVGPDNSLTGSKTADRVGLSAVVALANGNYVVGSGFWDNATMVDAGAATFGDGDAGVVGRVGAHNSLVGTTAADRVGELPVIALANGNYVVRSPLWDDGPRAHVGAVTLGDGDAGIAGDVSAANSLIGSKAGDQVGSNGVVELANGNYVVSSQFWDAGATADVCAVTFGRGDTGIAGVVSAANSVVGTATDDAVSFAVALANGNYVVFAPLWDNGSVRDAGAVVLGDGLAGTAGTIDMLDALVGTAAQDRVGSTVTALTNGNFVVHSPGWDRGSITDAGALTFIDGNAGLAGAIDADNSLVGSTALDRIGSAGILPLPDGGFVVRAPGWDHGGVADVGAVLAGDAVAGIAGEIAPGRALIGSSAGDQLGSGALLALADGDVVVGSPDWDRSTGGNEGAVTRLPGSAPFAGTISASNSLLGAAANDRIGTELHGFGNGRYAVVASGLDRVSPAGTLVDAGAVVLGPTVGEVRDENAAFGNTAAGGARMSVAGNGGIVAVGRPADNEVSLFDTAASGGPIFADGFEEPVANLAGAARSPFATASSSPDRPDASGRMPALRKRRSSCLDNAPPGAGVN